jgi:hypothetical protein
MNMKKVKDKMCNFPVFSLIYRSPKNLKWPNVLAIVEVYPKISQILTIFWEKI